MRIAKLSAYQVRIPLRRKIKHASFSRSESDSIIIRCQLEDGTVGWGESVPREYVTGETVDSVFSHYENTDFHSLLGADWNSLDELVKICQQIALPKLAGAEPEYTRRGCFGNAARCALEVSLIDAATRASGESFSSIFKHLQQHQSLFQPHQPVRYSAVLTSMRPAKQYLLSIMYRFTGFKHCKVKVGIPEIDDRTLLKHCRSFLGSKMDLRVDANEAWTRAILEQKAADFASFQISSLEQPVPHCEISSLKNIVNEISIPVMLDESLCSMSDAETAISNGYCDSFNLRISKLGGIIPTLDIAHLAQQSGRQYQLGCQVGETGILSAVGRHLASAVKGITFLEGSYDRYLLTENVINEDISFKWGGFAPPLAGPGLGITVNEDRLKKLTCREQHWKFS
ncbi:mandelate racemase/muconate lactonizing enzyme family protein [Gimesia aquarii]|uniref:L-Ala-D/L-Glu epimerase n=1 Tax=Gimesia aquarii TaxID=2527964 RepID=A0A517VWL3_9PLAN|nr:enolase C-terminal domain-like protein [Gimesia aquarii]QDT97382.1 L-Ala-D/L-Glu epimerase [Gimesia aquarii]